MGERTSYEQGLFCWVELPAGDPVAEKAFYQRLFGWGGEESQLPGDRVFMRLKRDDKVVGAIYTAPDGMPASAWLSYVAVGDAAATAARAGELGAKVLRGPEDVDELGIMALIQDPTGAVFAIWEGKAVKGAELVNAHGALTLNQLNTPDTDGATRFYSELFGWRVEKQEGTEDDYWGIFAGDRLNGGMMVLPADAGAPPHWLVYFGHDDLGAASAAIGEGGGQVLIPEIEVPGGRIVVGQDPQGAVFGLFAGRFDD
jgi:uncharacterized protein